MSYGYYDRRTNRLVDFQTRAAEDAADQLVPVHDLPTTLRTEFTEMAASLAAMQTQLATLIASNDPGIGLTDQLNALGTSATDGPDLVAALGVWAQNISTGTQIVTIRYKAQGAATATEGWRLMTPGAEHFFPCTNANQLSFISSAAGAEVGLHAI